MVILIYIVSLIIGIIMLLLAAGKMCGAAELKGHNAKELHIFAWCFFFPIFGYLYVIALPDFNCRQKNSKANKKNNKNKVSYQEDEFQEDEYQQGESQFWVCRKCGEMNPSEYKACQKCGTYR